MPRGMDEYTYGMGGGASVKKGKIKKQLRRAGKQIAAEKKAKKATTTKLATTTKPTTRPKTRPTSLADKIGKPKATTPRAVNQGQARTTIGAKSFDTRYKTRQFTSRRSADSYGSPAKKRQGELGGLSPVLKSVTRGFGKIQIKNKKKK